MSFAEMFKIPDNILFSNIRAMNLAKSIAIDLKVTMSDIHCPVIGGNKDGYLWKSALTMLDSTLFNPALEDELKQGFLMSFLLCSTPNLAEVLSALSKQHRIPTKPIEIHTIKGVLVGKTEEAVRIVDLINYDVRGRSRNFVDGGFAVSLLDKCEETAYLTVLTHIILLATKAITARDKCVRNARSRMTSLLTVLPISKDWFLTDGAANEIANHIQGFIPIRRVIVNLVISSEKTNSHCPGIAASVARAGRNLQMAGLTGFKMVRQFVVEPKSAILRHFQYEALYVKHLMAAYEELGDDAPFLKFLGHPKANLFNPHNYEILYAYAMGFASVAVPSMVGYEIGETTKASTYYKIGVKVAQKSAGANN